MNSTNLTNGTNIESHARFYAIEGFLIFCLCVLAVSTVLSNGMFLLTFYRDPLKCLRTPSAIFIAGLATANFLTGLIVEPSLVAWTVFSFISVDNRSLQRFARFLDAFSIVTITSSFLIMLALGIVQYLLIKHPRVYDKAVSSKSSLIGVILILIYSVFFATLPEMTGINREQKAVYYFVDLVVHNTLLTVVLVVLYLLIYFKFRQLAQRHRNSDLEETTEGQGPSIQPSESEKQRRQAEKDFVYGTIIMTLFLIITVWPLIITLFLAMVYGYTWGIFIAMVVSYFFLLWKFAVDPFVFAWRLRKYRKSLVLVMQRVCPCGKPSVPGATYTRQGAAAASPVSDHDEDEMDVTVVEGSGQAEL